MPSSETARFNINSRESAARSRAALGDTWVHRGMMLATLDIVAIFLAYLTSYSLRFSSFVVQYLPLVGIPTIIESMQGLFFLTFIWLFLIYLDNQYTTNLLTLREPFYLYQTLARTGVQSFVMVMAFSFLFRELSTSRFIFLLTVTFAFFLLVLNRQVCNWFNMKFVKWYDVPLKVVVVGCDVYATHFALSLEKFRSAAEVVAFFIFDRNTDQTPSKLVRKPVWRGPEELFENMKSVHFNILVLVSGYADAMSRDEFIHLVNLCEQDNILLYMMPPQMDVSVTRHEVGSFKGMPLIRLQDSISHPIYMLFKRIFDVGVALAVLVIGAPLWLLIAVVIKLDNPGAVIYRQMRIGLHGEPFGMYKFRSMVEGADEQLKDLVDLDGRSEPVFNIRDDRRVTRMGWLLRRTSLDEIPQMVNILLNQMSLIGPRPERQDLVERYSSWQKRRLKAKPGITGYQQVMSRGDPSLARRVEYDLFYLKNQSLFLDAYVLFKTFVVIIRGDGMK